MTLHRQLEGYFLDISTIFYMFSIVPEVLDCKFRKDRFDDIDNYFLFKTDLRLYIFIVFISGMQCWPIDLCNRPF